MNNNEINTANIKLKLDDLQKIENTIDILDTDTISSAKYLIIKSNIKFKRSIQKKNEKIKIEKQVSDAIELLINASNEDEYSDGWIQGYKILKTLNLPQTSQSLNKLIMRIRKKLAETNKWILDKKRIASKNNYRLLRNN